VEEFQKGHVDSEKIINIAYMFNTPEGKVCFGSDLESHLGIQKYSSLQNIKRKLIFLNQILISIMISHVHFFSTRHLLITLFIWLLGWLFN